MPKDDVTKKNCIKCSIENCKVCYGTKLSNICTICHENSKAFYEYKKIISCEIPGQV